jgi:hypothetical protein
MNNANLKKLVKYIKKVLKNNKELQEALIQMLMRYTGKVLNVLEFIKKYLFWI